MNLILNDNDGSEMQDFVAGLERATGEGWRLANWVANQPRTGAVSELKRYCRYVFKPLSLVFRRDVASICAWQQFFGVSYAAFSRLLRRPKTARLVVLTFIYMPKGGAAGRLFEQWVRYALESDHLDAVVCYTSAEVERYAGLFPGAAGKFRFLPCAVEDAAAGREGAPEADSRGVIAVGRSNRDYEYLIGELAGTGWDLTIVDDELAEPAGAPNVRVLRDVHGAGYLDLLAKSWACVIPLDRPDVSSGQSVLLHSWALGRSVVCTECPALTDDYVTDGSDAIVVEKRRGGVLAALERLRDEPGLWTRLSRAGRASYERSHTMAALGGAVGKIFTSL